MSTHFGKRFWFHIVLFSFFCNQKFPRPFVNANMTTADTVAKSCFKERIPSPPPFVCENTSKQRNWNFWSFLQTSRAAREEEKGGECNTLSKGSPHLFSLKAWSQTQKSGSVTTTLSMSERKLYYNYFVDIRFVEKKRRFLSTFCSSEKKMQNGSFACRLSPSTLSSKAV